MFYLVLTAHGLDVLLVWIIFFEMAVLYFASAVVLNCRLAAPKIAWLAFALMLIGALVTNVTVLQGEASVMFTSYVPNRDINSSSKPISYQYNQIVMSVSMPLNYCHFVKFVHITRKIKK